MSAALASSSSTDMETLRGRLSYDEPMSRHTHWRVGGPARLYFVPADRADLADFLGALDPSTRIYYIGLGSNLLVRDEGIGGAVVALGRGFRELKRSRSQDVEAGAGTPCTTLARACSSWGLGPADFFAGIPGTVGGALAMNAGAFGGETWDSVRSVDTLDRSGVARTRSRAGRRYSHRRDSSPGPPEPGRQRIDHVGIGAACLAPAAQVALEFLQRAEMGVEQRIVGRGGQDGVAADRDAGDGRVGHRLHAQQPAQERAEHRRQVLAPARVHRVHCRGRCGRHVGDRSA